MNEESSGNNNFTVIYKAKEREQNRQVRKSRFILFAFLMYKFWKIGETINIYTLRVTVTPYGMVQDTSRSEAL